MSAPPVRTGTAVAELAKRPSGRDPRWAIVTDPEGRLLAVPCREDLERA